MAHPATDLLDAEGRVVLADVRRDDQVWLDPSLVVTVLEGLAP